MGKESASVGVYKLCERLAATISFTGINRYDDRTHKNRKLIITILKAKRKRKKKQVKRVARKCQQTKEITL